VGLEQGPLRIVSTIEELLKRKNNGSGLENRDYGHKALPCWPRDTPLSLKAGTNFTDKWRSLADLNHGIIITQNKEFDFDLPMGAVPHKWWWWWENIKQ
jgi:hypothetical protein